MNQPFAPAHNARSTSTDHRKVRRALLRCLHVLRTMDTYHKHKDGVLANQAGIFLSKKRAQRQARRVRGGQ